MDMAQRDRRYLAREEGAEGVQFAREAETGYWPQSGM
jgi:hypothetical protein